MYRKDLITSEIERLAQVLAKIMGLKTELKLKEAEILMEETLLNHFKLEKIRLMAPEDEDFIRWLTENDLGPEKLNILGDFLFSELDFEQHIVPSLLIAKKLNLLYQHLADHYQVVHLINLGRQKYIQQYLN